MSYCFPQHRGQYAGMSGGQIDPEWGDQYSPEYTGSRDVSKTGLKIPDLLVKIKKWAKFATSNFAHPK